MYFSNKNSVHSRHNYLSINLPLSRSSKLLTHVVYVSSSKPGNKPYLMLLTSKLMCNIALPNPVKHLFLVENIIIKTMYLCHACNFCLLLVPAMISLIVLMIKIWPHYIISLIQVIAIVYLSTYTCINAILYHYIQA